MSAYLLALTGGLIVNSVQVKIHANFLPYFSSYSRASLNGKMHHLLSNKTVEILTIEPCIEHWNHRLHSTQQITLQSMSECTYIHPQNIIVTDLPTVMGQVLEMQ